MTTSVALEDSGPGGVDRRIITAGIVGNVLEWYDFAVYGYFPPVIGKQFFPSDDPTAAVIADDAGNRWS